MQYRLLRIYPDGRVTDHDVPGDRVAREAIPTASGAEGWMHYPVKQSAHPDDSNIQTITTDEALKIVQAAIIRANNKIIRTCQENIKRVQEVEL